MRYRLLALDLDGTLLDDHNRISLRNRDAIWAARDRGVVVTLSTGRMYRSAIRFAHELEMEVPLITYNGALIKDSGGQVYRDLPLPLPAARIALAIAREYDLHVNLFMGDELFVDRDDEWTKRYHRSSSVPPKIVPDLKRVLTAAPNKVLFLGTEEELQPVWPVLAEELAGQAHITSSSPQFVEIIHPRVSKQSGLAYLLKQFGLTAKEAIAIGDNYNDLEMITYAGLGVAMSNAPKEVRARADYVTGDNNDGGVAQVIERFILSSDEELCKCKHL
ncbi:MAG TPA: HAD family phosphatase [Firmicutes bacterium]|nr:HAD family phosphatase [Bacillota bacterium]